MHICSTVCESSQYMCMFLVIYKKSWRMVYFDHTLISTHIRLVGQAAPLRTVSMLSCLHQNSAEESSPEAARYSWRKQGPRDLYRLGKDRAERSWVHFGNGHGGLLKLKTWYAPLTPSHTGLGTGLCYITRHVLIYTFLAC